ncbi:MAG: MgtC/SapB family protein [Gemmatimonadota bacterium]
MNSEAFLQLLVSAGLGLLVGLQREWTASSLAGIRTFALITLLGTVSAQLVGELGGWIVTAGFVVVGGTMIVTWYEQARERDPDPGHTTLAAALVMYLDGAALVLLNLAVGVALAGCVAVLLQWKKPLHSFVERIGEVEIRAIMQLTLIALVALPALPNKTYGPYDVFNPFQIWLMVVLIGGISVAGYLAYKLLGARAGTLLAGFLGGVISSTATTVSYAHRSRRTPTSAERGALVIVLASTVVFARVIFELAVVAPGVLGSVLPPLLIAMAGMTLLSATLYRFTTRTFEAAFEIDEDPSNLRVAIAFGALYAVVLFAVAVAREHFGDQGLFVVAALSGLTDMDAITLSTAKLIESGRIEISVGWRMILVGAMSNLIFKAGTVAVLGHRRLLGRVAIVFGTALAGGIALILFWPG